MGIPKPYPTKSTQAWDINNGAGNGKGFLSPTLPHCHPLCSTYLCKSLEVLSLKRHYLITHQILMIVNICETPVGCLFQRFIYFFLQIPKIVHQEILQSSEILCSAVGHGISRELFQKRFNIFSAENVYQSIFSLASGSDASPVKSETFGFTHLMDLSPAEVVFLANGSFMERLLFAMLRWDRQFLDGILDVFMEAMDGELNENHPDRGKVRAVTRLLLIPSRSETNLLRRKFTIGPGYDPCEDLVVSHQERLLSNIKLLNATYTFIPQAQAPPVCFHRCHLLIFCYLGSLMFSNFIYHYNLFHDR